VQTIYGLHGIAIERDASQQSSAGASVDAALDALKPGDLLFFSDRPDHRITHVAMSAGEGRIVHLALGRGGYRVETLSNAGDPYVKALRERYLFARRVL
jgi:cell wall-associated NlpC family hydrolase